jgi:ABC-type oligopeptide transport system substrate-binding subunit
VGSLSGDSAGPFFQVPLSEANKTKLARNPNYWGKQHFFESIELIKFSDPKIARNYFEDKELSLLSGAVPGLSNANKVFLPTPTKYFLNFNTKSSPFTDSRFRKALVYSIDKNEWADLLHLNLILISKLENLFEKDEQPNSFYNLIKAKDIVSTINTERVRTNKLKLSERRPLILLYPNELEAIATNLKMQWLKNINLQVEIVPKFKHSSVPWDLELFSINVYPHLEDSASDSYFPLFSAVQIISEVSTLKGIASNPWGGLDLSQGN